MTVQNIPVTAAANQSLSAVLDNQACLLGLRTLNGSLYISVSIAGAPVISTRICRDRQRILVNAQYRGMRGELIFIDTQGSSDPAFSGLGTRFLLLYVTP